jgi:hypothetical protein
MSKEELEEKKKRKKKRKVKKKKGKKDACYHKVRSRYDVWPSAYASGALVKCRKVGAANWGNKSKKKNESLNEEFEPHMMYDPKTGKSEKANKEEDHHRLAKKGYTHVDSDEIRDEFEKEGGALGMKNLKKATKASEEEIEKTLDGMGDVLNHRDGDLIRADGQEVKKEEMSLKKKIRIRIVKSMREST